MLDIDGVSLASMLINAFIATVFIASGACWLRAIIENRVSLRGLPQKLVPELSRKLPFWNAGDALVMFGLLQILTGVGLVFLQHQGYLEFANGGDLSARQKADNQFTQLMAMSVSSLIATIVMVQWMRARSSGAIDALGLAPTWAEIVFGLKASLYILPPVLLISGAASWWIQYEHPVLDLLKIRRSPWETTLLFFGTAAITPVMEELLFRVFLLGGLERLFEVLGERPNSPEADVPLVNTQTRPASDWHPSSYWPIMISSFVFAIMHFGQGAAPIPLFALAVALGFLYRRTGSVISCIVVHAVLNCTTLVVESIRLGSG